jgi:hypothetical protein
VAISESLDGISKSLRNILGNLDTAKGKIDNVGKSSSSLQTKFNEADRAVKNLIKSLEKAVEVQNRLESGASRLSSAYSRATGPSVSATMSTQSGVPSQGAGSSMMPSSLGNVSAPSIGAGAGVPLAAVTGVRVPGMAGMPAMGATKPLSGAPTFGGIPAEMALLGLAGMNTQTGSVGGAGGAGGSKALGLAKIGGRLALTGAAAGLQFAYNATPGYRDAMAFQEALFTTAFAASTYDNPYNEDRIKRQVRASFGPMMSSSTDALGAAALLTSRGLGPNNRAFGAVMGEAGSAFALTGMSNPAAASGLANLQGGSTSGKLAQYGIFTNSFQDGSYKGLGNVIDQMWARWFGSQSAKIPMEVFEAQLLGGWIGADLRTLFGDSPELYQIIVEGLRLKAKAGGQAGIDFSSRRGRNSYATVGRRLGMTEENLPRLTQGSVNESRYGAIGATEDALNSGMRISAGLIRNFNQKVEESAEVLDLFYQGKGVVGSFLDSTEGLAAASAAATVAIASLQALADSINLLTGGGGAPPIVATGGGKPGSKPGGKSSGGRLGLLGSLAAGAGAFATTLALQPGVNAFGKDSNEAGFLGGGFTGSAKDFGNIMARSGIGALTGLALGGPWGALIGAVLEGGYGIQQGITNPNFNVKGADTESTLVQQALGWVAGLFSAKGTMGSVQGSGSSTSDNIHALLSPGEYVLNARAVQAVGVGALDHLNSVGQTFGSAFASPAKNFDKGGPTTGGFPVLAPNDPRLQTYSVAGRSIKLSSEYASILLPAIREYAEDPVLSPVTYLSGHEYRKMYNPSTGTYSGNWSYHAAGVAYDIDADYWGMPGSARVPTPSEAKAIRKILASNPRVQWGGDWSGNSRDPHHWEVRRGANPGTSPAYEGYGEDAAKNVTTEPAKVSESKTEVGAVVSTDLMRPMASAAGGVGYFMKGLSISPFGSSGGGLSASFSLSDTVSSALGQGSSLIGVLGGITGSAPDRADGNGKGKPNEDSGDPVSDTGSSPSGSGAKWLYDYLVSKGLRGNDLRILWTIGMRESSGTPSLIANVALGSRFNWPKVPSNIKFNPKDKYGYNGYEYDVGLFQINSEAHFDKVGGNMLNVISADDNFNFMKRLSNNFQKWTDWGITGFSNGSLSYINWGSWGANWAGPNGLGAKTQANDRNWLNQFDKYNTKGYSQGSWRTTNEVARLHEGEMVLPAQAAEDFRGMLREALSGGGQSGAPVTINVHIAQASEEEAMRFARKVKTILDGDKTLDSLRSK